MILFLFGFIVVLILTLLYAGFSEWVDCNWEKANKHAREDLGISMEEKL